jgi:hypothetical protein
MAGRTLTRRLERLEARAALVDPPVSIVLRFVDPEGGVRESIVALLGVLQPITATRGFICEKDVVNNGFTGIVMVYVFN